MNNYERAVKIQLIKRALAEAKAGVEIDMLLAKNAIIPNDDFDEVKILFSLIEYIIKMDLKGSDLVSAVASKRLVAKISKDNKIVDISFTNETMPDYGNNISLLFE